MREVFEAPEGLVKAEQALNASMSDLTKSIQEVRKLATISGLFIQAAEQNEATARAFRETANRFDGATKSLLESMGGLMVEISDTRKKIDGALDDLRQLAIKAIVVQGAVVVVATLLGVYFLRR